MLFKSYFDWVRSSCTLLWKRTIDSHGQEPTFASRFSGKKKDTWEIMYINPNYNIWIGINLVPTFGIFETYSIVISSDTSKRYSRSYKSDTTN